MLANLHHPPNNHYLVESGTDAATLLDISDIALVLLEAHPIPKFGSIPKSNRVACLPACEKISKTGQRYMYQSIQCYCCYCPFPIL